MNFGTVFSSLRVVGAPGIGSRIPALRDRGEAPQVHVPALPVNLARLLGKVDVPQADDRSVPFRHEVDLDPARAGGNGVLARLLPLPAPGEDDPVGSVDLDVFPARPRLVVDLDPVDPSGARIELG